MDGLMEGIFPTDSTLQNHIRNGIINVIYTKMVETKKTRAVEIIKDEKAPVVLTSEWTKETAQAHVDAFAKRNPAKYEIKKEALAKWVASF